MQTLNQFSTLQRKANIKNDRVRFNLFNQEENKEQYDNILKQNQSISANSQIRSKDNLSQPQLNNSYLKQIDLPSPAQLNLINNSQLFSQKSAQFLEKLFFFSSSKEGKQNNQADRNEVSKNKNRNYNTKQISSDGSRIDPQQKNSEIHSNVSTPQPNRINPQTTAHANIQNDRQQQQNIIANQHLHKRYLTQGLLSKQFNQTLHSKFENPIKQSKNQFSTLSQKEISKSKISNQSYELSELSQDFTKSMNQRYNSVESKEDHIAQNTLSTEINQVNVHDSKHNSLQKNIIPQRIHQRSSSHKTEQNLDAQSNQKPRRAMAAKLAQIMQSGVVDFKNVSTSSRDKLSQFEITQNTENSLKKEKGQYLKHSLLYNKKQQNQNLSLSSSQIYLKAKTDGRKYESGYIPSNSPSANSTLISFSKSKTQMTQSLAGREAYHKKSILESDSNILFLNSDLSATHKNISPNPAYSTTDLSTISTKYQNKFVQFNLNDHISQDEKLNKLQQFQTCKSIITSNIQKRNFEEVIQKLKELLTMSSKERNLDAFAETMVYLGQLHYFNHDLDNALYSFLQLKNLSEIIGSAELKMRSLILLGQVMQDEQNYDFAICLYRIAICYSWYLNDEGVETDLYDKLGFLYFMKGDISKAKYFHSRSIQHQSENSQSESRNQCLNFISKFFSHPDKFIPNLNQMVLAKLGLVSYEQDQLKFSTKISAELQLQMLKEDKEIIFANNYPFEINAQDLIYSKAIPEGMENVKEYQIIQKILNQKNSFTPIVLRNTQYKDPQTQNIVDHSLLKMTIEEKVQKVKIDVYDNKRLQRKLKEAQVAALINRQAKNQKLFYNHCSPNRNVLGFKYTFRPSSLKMNSYFKKIEDMILKTDS